MNKLLTRPRYALIFLLMLVFLPSGFSQKKGLDFNGNISLGSFHYYDNNPTNGLNPFGISFGVNANISYGKFSIPIGVSINNQGTSFQNPFNRYGISPTYKWVRVNLGWRRMQFSKFTMSGVQFFGAGIELTPGILRANAMHGKLDYRIPGLPRELNETLPDRKISAIKLGIGSRQNHFDLIFMKAQDEVRELDTLTKPKENVTIGADLKASFWKNKIVLNVDGGLSVFTENRKQDDSWLKDVNVPKVANSILEPNNSTHVNYAVEAGLAFHLGAVTLKNQYRRVMPEYQSLGLNYLRNDLESYLFSPNLKLWNNKVVLGGSVGLEKNNLDKLRNMNQSRVISSANLNLRPDPSHMIHLQYANYSFDQTISFDSLITNSIIIQQVNRTLGGSYIYSSFGGNNTQMISITANLQDALNANEKSLNSSTFSAMINYSISKIDSKSTLNFGVNYFDINLNDSKIRQIGLNAGYSYRSGSNILSLQGGSMVSIDDKLMNVHLTARYRMALAKNISLELSSRMRQNERVTGNNRFMLRSDLRVVMKI